MVRCYFLNKKTTRRILPAGRGLHVFGLAFKPLSYDVCSILNTIPNGLRKPFNGTLHCSLQGDAGVTALEAHEHVVGHCLCQGMTLLLQVATNGLFQLGYLPPGRVKKREHETSFWCHVPSPDRAEADGHQSSVRLA
jgi:hypothetical protein